MLFHLYYQMFKENLFFFQFLILSSLPYDTSAAWHGSNIITELHIVAFGNSAHQPINYKYYCRTN